jgi:hypothetical protein
MDRPKPLPGDAIFIAGKTFSSQVNILGQTVLFPRTRMFRRHFSHVAVALERDFAYEAGKGPQITWTDQHLPSGVRLIPIIDLIKESRRISVLRSSRPPEKPELGVVSNFVAALYGAPYSLLDLKRDREAVLPFIKRMVPDGVFQTKGSHSDVVEMVQKSSTVWELLVPHLPPNIGTYASREFFCSQLVTAILTDGGFLEPDDRLKPVPLAELHDALIKKGWKEVFSTDYATEMGAWIELGAEEWKRKTGSTQTWVKYAQSQLFLNGMLGAATTKAEDDLNSIKDLVKRLEKKQL